MTAITERELIWIEFLYQVGATNVEIVKALNLARRREDEECYRECILEEAPNE